MSLASDLRTLVTYRGFRWLLTIRLISQTGDGLFQAGLATLFFFAPERMASATDVAAAFTVLLLPFTLVGPFAGPLLDRWRRRQVLLYANLARALLAVVVAILMTRVGVGPAVYVTVLVTLGVNRFLLSALSAGLPRVVPRHLLLMANSITPTLGAAAAVIGAGVGFLLGLVLPAGGTRNAGLLVSAAVIFALASLAATSFAADELGPGGEEDRPDTGTEHEGAPGARGRMRAGQRAGLAAVFATVLTDLAAALRYLRARGTPAAALAVMAAHRFVYGVNFLVLILASRNLLVDPTNAQAGLAMFALLSAVSFAGSGLAIVATPVATERVSPHHWIVICLALGSLSQLIAALAPRTAIFLAAGFLLGLSVQGAKIAVDTIVQRDTADAFRGRAFALYDVFYNAAFVSAAGLAAALLPDTGWDRTLFIALMIGVALLALSYARANTAPREVSGRS
ncbi:MAG: MFS transporter [Bowdeniella nasicola]|nr:MFS transporter [Bowdeniella nasicola]